MLGLIPDRRAVVVCDSPCRAMKLSIWSTVGRSIRYLRTIYFRDRRNGASLGGVWAAEVSTEPTLAVGPPRRLFDDPYFVEGGWRPRAYDLSPDGKHFVMLEDVEPPRRTERFQLIQNFFEILRRDAPAQR